MNVAEIHSRSILNPSGLAKYCINPYVGCEHGCVYCYARFMCRYSGHQGELWGSFVDVKMNAPDVLEKELKKKQRGPIFMSSVTDPYQPIEKKYAITRKILQKLLEHDFPVAIQTKSSLIQRDIDIISKMKGAEVGMTIAFLDDIARRNFEPLTSPIEERLETIGVFSETGIRTYVFVGPFLPGISGKNLEGLISRIAEAGADYIYFDKLNIKCGNWETIKPIIMKHYPELFEKYNKILFGGGSDYYETIKKRVQALCKENSLGVKFCF